MYHNNYNANERMKRLPFEGIRREKRFWIECANGTAKKAKQHKHIHMQSGGGDN
jgi:hypothetical protein